MIDKFELLLSSFVAFGISSLIAIILAVIGYSMSKEKKSKWLSGAIIGIIIGAIVVSSFLYVIFEIPNTGNQNDFPNWLTLVVEVAFGIIISLIVYDKTTSSSKYVKEKVDEIRKITGQTKTASDEKAKAAINQIMNNFEGIKKNIEDMRGHLDTYNSYQGEINEDYQYDYHDLAMFEYNYMQKEIQSIETTVGLAEYVLKIQDAKAIVSFCKSFKKLEISGTYPFEFEDSGHLGWMDEIKSKLETHLEELEQESQ